MTDTQTTEAAAHVIKLVIGGKTKKSRFTPLPVDVDWNALPDASQAFVIAYGLKQYLADGMAGAESEAEAHNEVKARHEKLKAGDLSRAKGERTEKPDTVDSRALKLATAFIREALKAEDVKADAATIKEAAQELVKDEPKWKAEAQKQLDAEAKAKADPGDRAKSIVAGILAKVKKAEPAEESAT